MRWSWKIARVAGVDVRVHVTFLLLLVWQGVVTLVHGGRASAVAAGVVLTLVVFAVVVAHELGHALVARRFGIRTRDILLLPFGGVARLERMPEKPAQELLVAIAGPAVNVFLAGALFAVLTWLRVPLAFSTMAATGGAAFVLTLFWVNVAMATFNLVPAFPLDGGRMLRAVLATRLDYVRATVAAAHVGQLFAIAMAFVGLMLSPMLVVVALFVWVAGAAEASSVRAKALLHGLPVHAAMTREPRTLAAAVTLADAARLLLATAQTDFPVVDAAGRLVGVLTQRGLVRGLASHGPAATTETSMEREWATADPQESLDLAVTRLAASSCGAMPVVAGGRVVGMLTMEKVGELLALEGAVTAAQREALVLQARHVLSVEP